MDNLIIVVDKNDIKEKLIAYPKKWSALSSNLNLTKEGRVTNIQDSE